MTFEPPSDGRVDETARASGHADVSANLSLVSAVSGGVTHVNESRDKPTRTTRLLRTENTWRISHRGSRCRAQVSTLYSISKIY
jgi:hypothetical protein